MLLKTNDRDVVEQVRSDSHMREVIEAYRHIAAISAMTDEKQATEAKQTKKVIDFLTWWQFGEGYKWNTVQLEILRLVIQEIAKVYRELTGKSPRTTDPVSGEHPFSALVIEIFKREGLDPPKPNRVKEATKKSK